MIITDFDHSHIEQAMSIAKANYEEERRHVIALPQIEILPDLKHFADNHLGVTAMEGKRLIGFLCAYYPREDAFGSTNVKGTWSPIHSHGVNVEEKENFKREEVWSYKERIYSLLYQAAAKKWVEEGIRSHGISLYTHDKEAINSFFYNGFGLRCIDAIRSLDNIPNLITSLDLEKAKLEYCEVLKEEWGELLDQHNALIRHLGNSPTFMHFDSMDVEELYRHTSEDVRYFSVKAEGKYIAYVKISTDGENFATEDHTMMNICGAYCDPQYRGKGVYHNLISYLMTILKQEGYQLLGVDCESFNPNARGFWLKYFTEYTHSLVRRIDDKAFLNRK